MAETTGPMRPLRLQLKLRNNVLMRLREEMGLSARQVAEGAGVTYGEYLRHEGLKKKPYGRRSGFGPVVYDWTPLAKNWPSSGGCRSRCCFPRTRS